MSIFGALMGKSESKRLPSRKQYTDRIIKERDDAARRGVWVSHIGYDDFVRMAQPAKNTSRRSAKTN